MTEIYKQHDKAFANVSAYVITTKDGKPVGKVAFKYGNRVTCYLHIGGSRMVKGWAGGGGYDRATAAFEAACAALEPVGDGSDSTFPNLHIARIKLAASKHDGWSWDRRIDDEGYRVLQAV